MLLSATNQVGMAAPKGRPDACRVETPEVGVALRGGVYHLIALDPASAGSSLLMLQGLFVDVPHRYSVQVGEHLHVAPPPGLGHEDRPDGYAWRYLNHSCAPNAGFVGRELIALRDILAWEEITFDYNTTEYEITAPFACHCGHCDRREIRGFKHLTLDEQASLAPRLVDHLRARLAATLPALSREDGPGLADPRR